MQPLIPEVGSRVGKVVGIAELHADDGGVKDGELLAWREEVPPECLVVLDARAILQSLAQAE